MPFRITMRSSDVQQALSDQGYTAGRAGSLDKLDTNISTRAAPDDILVNTGNKVDGARIDANISSRAAPGDSMELVEAARAAIWNHLVPTTPASGSFGEKVKDNIDASISSRAQVGAAMDLNSSAETKVKSQSGGAMDDRGFTSGRGPNLDKLDANVSTRAAAGDILVNTANKVDGARIDANISTRATADDVDTKLGDRGVNTTRMAKLDNVSAPASTSDSVAAGSNTTGLTVQLDTGYRTVVEIRYSCGAAADFYIEGSDDGSTWYEGDTFSESGAATNKIVGYLSARRYIRMRSPTTGIDLSFELVALL